MVTLSGFWPVGTGHCVIKALQLNDIKIQFPPGKERILKRKEDLIFSKLFNFRRLMYIRNNALPVIFFASFAF
jgi:hypothetical protein